MENCGTICKLTEGIGKMENCGTVCTLTVGAGKTAAFADQLQTFCR